QPALPRRETSKERERTPKKASSAGPTFFLVAVGVVVLFVMFSQHEDHPSNVDAPMHFLHAYYADVNRHDADAAIQKWKNPPPNLRNLVGYTEWIKIVDATVKEANANIATVDVRVLGKEVNKTKQRTWAGTITIENTGGAWKIAEMKL